MQCKKEENSVNCGCSWPDCPRKGICCDCVTHHRQKGEIPGCFFPADAETTYDRSVDYFVSQYHKNKVDESEDREISEP
jgi:hypothetical protein